jgi:hypothetical protein
VRLWIQETSYELLLIHLVERISLRQTAVMVKLRGFAGISDVALLKRLRPASEWLRWLHYSL